MSNIRSAVRDTPRAYPNETIVSTGSSLSLAVAASKLVAKFGRRQVGGVDDAVRRSSCSGAVMSRSRAMPSSAGRSGGERMAAPGLVVAPHQLAARRSRDRGFRRARPGSSGSAAAGRRRRSRGCGRPFRRPRAPAGIPCLVCHGRKRSSSETGRLSTQSQPMSSSASSTLDLPAPDMPVTSSRRGGGRRAGTAARVRTSGRAGRERARPWTRPRRSGHRR